MTLLVIKKTIKPRKAAADQRPSMASVMAAVIRSIPRGRVMTYGAVAKAAGFPRCARDVARVLHQTAGLPWQRVLGSGGRISLPRELGLEQRFLLEAEGIRFAGRRVPLTQYELRSPVGRRKKS